MQSFHILTLLSFFFFFPNSNPLGICSVLVSNLGKILERTQQKVWHLVQIKIQLITNTKRAAFQFI